MELFNAPLDLDAPLLMFFEEIEEFRILSKSAKITETDAQIMDMALIILQDSGTFTQSLIEREQKQEIEKTWAALTTFLTMHLEPYEKRQEFQLVNHNSKRMPSSKRLQKISIKIWRINCLH